jgi:chromosome segregation ATPase
LKENERNAHENVTLNEQLDELSSKFKDLETQNVEFKAKVDEYESALKLKNDELSDLLNIKEKLESELSSLQTEILRVTGDLDEKSRIIARNLDRIKLLESELESISVESSTLKQNLFNSERGLAASSSALSELQFQFESLKEDYDEVEEQRSFLQDELNLKLQELELVKSQASLGAAKDGLVETLNAEICSLTQKLEGHESLRAKYNEMETQNSMVSFIYLFHRN